MTAGFVVPMSKERPLQRVGSRLLLRGLLVLTCTVIVTLCGAEFLLRVIDFTAPAVSDVYGPYRFDPELGWLAPPNSASQSVSGNRTISSQHNSLGIRERELSDIAPDRILFLGDSFTWGFDAEVEERFTNLLQKELPQYGMVNAGVSGYGTDQQFLLMQRLWNHVNPKVVVVTFCVDNDRDDNSSSLRYLHYKPYFVGTPEGRLQVRGHPLPQPKRNGTRRTWAESFALVRFAADIHATLRNRQIIVPDPTERLIDLMRRTVEARGAQLVVGLQRREPKLEAHLRAQKIPYTTFDDAPAYPTAGWHWTPEGNSEVAKRYRALFAEIGILPSLTPPSDLAAPVRSAIDRRQPGASSVLSPQIWLAAAQAIPDELTDLGDYLKYWTIAVYDTRGVPRVAVMSLVLMVIGIAMLVFLFWRHRRMAIVSGPRDGLAKAFSSFGVFLGLAAAPPLVATALLEASQVRMVEITHGFVAGLVIAAFGRAVALGVLAPDAPKRRLIAVEDATARALAGHLVWAARALGVLILAISVHKALAAPAELTIATNMLFALIIGALLLHLLLSHRHGWGAAESQARATWLRALGWFILGVITIALVAGYPIIAAFVAGRLVSIVVVVGAFYLLLVLSRALFAQRLAINTQHGGAIAASFGVSERWLGFITILTCGGILLAVILTALVLCIGPWPH